MTTQLSYHFSLEEAIHSNIASRLGIDNTPSEIVIEDMKFTALNMENVRNVLNNHPILVSSWFRSHELNLIVSHANSQHPEGKAVDFICPAFGDPLECCQELEKRKNILRYDQLIYEHTWIHISFVKENARMEELTNRPGNVYVVGLQA